MRQVFALSLTLLLSFCATFPDAVPPDTGWQPQDVNNANLILMAVHPADLVQGRNSNALPAGLKADPVLRLWHGHEKPLPPSELADTAAPSQGASPPPPANGAPDAGGQ